MALMYVSAIIAFAVAMMIYQHLRTGRIQWQEKVISAVRAQQPFSYWLLIAIEIGILSLFLLGVFTNYD
ncbi:MAG: hypothetical protein J0L88_05305 [Xanthomonadales bacterium]|nr:hypothetical protein [Xanthomonadales bacterium]